MTIKVYFAGLTSDAKRLREIAKQWERAPHGGPEIRSTSTWLDLVDHIPNTPAFAPEFWRIDFEDITRSNVLVIGAFDSKTSLRGALVEAGYALGVGVTVVTVGKHPSLGTWQYARGIIRMDTYEDALLWIRLHYSEDPESVASLTA